MDNTMDNRQNEMLGVQQEMDRSNNGLAVWGRDLKTHTKPEGKADTLRVVP
jgi:hypothetical protein